MAAEKGNADTLLVTTKLHIPLTRPERVFRSRLLERMEDGLSRGHRLTLVSAPAGYGKTTLLAEWVRGGDRPVAWVSLDAGDNDSVRFWSHVAAALQEIHAGAGEPALAALQSPQPLPVETALTALINEADAIPVPFTLVLDDYHLVDAAEVHGALGFLLEHQPPNMHLVISTRSDPPLPIFRLRARGQLTELRREDLRFSHDEALAFLNRGMGLALTREQAASLQARTEGWIVGLQLAALSLQGRQDTDAFIAAFAGSHHYVLEYLTEEVVRRQPVPVQQFLVQTSVLERLCGSLCDVLLDNQGAATGDANWHDGPRESSVVHRSPISSLEMLAYLQQQNLFVVPMDDKGRWYRYHHLFADLLANLLRQERPVERIHELHRRASEWYEQNGFQDEAVQHALQAEAFERAGSLIEGAAKVTLSQGRLTVLLRWLQALPETVVLSRPQLRLYQAWALHLSGRSDTAEQMLRETKRTVRARPASPENEALRGKVAALLTGIAALHGGTSETIEQAEEALSYLPANDLVSRARVHVALGTAYAYQDEPEEGERAWRQAVELALEAGNPFLATAAIELLAGTQIYHQGRLREGVQILQQVLDLGAAPDGSLHPFAATAHALLADVFLEWNDLDAAASYLDKGLELLQRGGIAYGLPHTYCAKARLAQARDDRQGALAALQAAMRATAALPMWHIILHQAACQTRLNLWLGDVGGAARWARADQAATEHDLPEELPHYLRELQSLSLARVSLARSDVDDALGLLVAVISGAESAGRTAHVIEAYLLRALALQARGELDAALVSLERSLLLAEPEGYLRLYLEAGEPLRDLLSMFRAKAQAQRGNRSSQKLKPLLLYANKLLATFADPGRQAILPPSEEQPPGAQDLVETLTARELEVLQLVCEGLSNREIAERLTVTLNTVKKHTSNVYGKLAVQSRAQAIVRARDLGLC